MSQTLQEAIVPHLLDFGSPYRFGTLFSDWRIIDDFTPQGVATIVLPGTIRAGEFFFLPYCIDLGETSLLSPRCFVGTVRQPIALDEVATKDENVADELKAIREYSVLSVADIARLCGLRRRQVYNLLDGEATEPHRAARIRRLGARIVRWSKRVSSPATLRSALLAPLDEELRDFVTIMSSEAPNAEQEATSLFDAYLDSLGSARPITRTASRGREGRLESLQHLRELYGDARGPVEN